MRIGSITAVSGAKTAVTICSCRPSSPCKAASKNGFFYVLDRLTGELISAEPYAKVGDRVDTTTVVCIIEAMKVFNEIPAEVRGKIVAVLCEDGEAVEFDKPLFKVDTSG